MDLDIFYEARLDSFNQPILYQRSGKYAGAPIIALIDPVCDGALAFRIPQGPGHVLFFLPSMRSCGC